jgi:hypothetical protein
VITFYALPAASLMMVPGVGVEPIQARGPRDFKATGKRQRIKDLANSLPFPVSEESEDYGHPDGHLFQRLGASRLMA